MVKRKRIDCLRTEKQKQLNVHLLFPQHKKPVVTSNRYYLFDQRPINIAIIIDLTQQN